MIRLGAFEVAERIARGGMSEVYAGVHHSPQSGGRHVPVAIKVMNARMARSPSVVAAFRAEVRAVARFVHPGIVMIFDHGEVPSDAAEASDGRLPLGSPYIVMEYASRGSLDKLGLALAWQDLRSTVLSLLDALAHAHARGVVHRDIKPGNVLVAGAEDERPGLKLADFGIAHLDHDDEQGSGIRGTPAYMPPEQIAGATRDFGPWTDLYALGTLAWELSTGRPPFDSANVEEVIQLQQLGSLPELLPRRAVPPGFESWLGRMLEKDPSRRFRRAADAAFALARLGDPVEIETPLGTVDRLVTNPTLTLEDTVLVASTAETDLMTLVDQRSASSEGELTPSYGLKVAPEPPPQPPSWERAVPPQPSIRLVGAGLSLYGLRSIPLVDRNTQRDRIWRLLSEVSNTDTPRLILLHGAAGYGKSRLAEWMSERAHELGRAETLKAIHGPMGGPADGLAPMFARHLQLGGLSRRDVMRRVRRVLLAQDVDSDREAAAVTELIQPATPDWDGPVVRFRDPTERHAVMARIIERAAAHRPVVLWLDDVQWGPDALVFAEYAMRTLSCQVLFVLTARDEALYERPLENALLDTLMALPHVERQAVPALPPKDHAELVSQLLGLEGDLAAQVVRRTRGNPLFAVQLVGDWVGRGVLMPGATGFTLKPGARSVLPDDLHQVWNERLERLLGTFGDQARPVLEVAAALGQDVGGDEWQQACAGADLVPPAGLVEALIEARLANPREDGWSFVHGMLRECLERTARETGRWTAHNLAAARMLKGRAGAGVAERLGLHLLQAGEAEEALGPLLAGAQERVEKRDQDGALHLLDLRDKALERRGISRTDERWGRGWLMRGACELAQERFDAATRLARRTQQHARQHGYRGLEAEAWEALGRVAASRTDPVQAAVATRKALDIWEWLGDKACIARCVQALIPTAVLQSELDQASELTERAMVLYTELHDLSGQGYALRYRGDIARMRSQWQESERWFREAMLMHERAGNQQGLNNALHGVAEAVRLGGAPDEALAIYQEVIEREEARGYNSLTPRFNTGLCFMQTEKWRQAQDIFEPIRQTFELQRRKGDLGLVNCALLACAGALRDWGAFDTHLEAARTLLAEASFVDVDNAWPAQVAGDKAAEAGQDERARGAWELALSQWTAMGEAERIAQIEACLAALPSD